ncbi:hypothetical protein HK101_002568 [Irineochytrium annulatum]|nr:hypothetical protein HK101_002568 [Irineochytrium annulatum]
MMGERPSPLDHTMTEAPVDRMDERVTRAAAEDFLPSNWSPSVIEDDFVMDKVPGLYRLLEIYKDSGSGGLVDKVILCQEHLKKLCNDVSPESYRSVSNIDFGVLSNFRLSFVGVYGNRPSVLAYLLKQNAITRESFDMLLASDQRSSLVLRPGLYLLVPPGALSVGYVVHWPSDGVFDDGGASRAGDSDKRNMVTLQRYLTKMSSKVVCAMTLEEYYAFDFDRGQPSPVTCAFSEAFAVDSDEDDEFEYESNEFEVTEKQCQKEEFNGSHQTVLVPRVIPRATEIVRHQITVNTARRAINFLTTAPKAGASRFENPEEMSFSFRLPNTFSFEEFETLAPVLDKIATGNVKPAADDEDIFIGKATERDGFVGLISAYNDACARLTAETKQLARDLRAETESALTLNMLLAYAKVEDFETLLAASVTISDTTQGVFSSSDEFKDENMINALIPHDERILDKQETTTSEVTTSEPPIKALGEGLRNFNFAHAVASALTMMGSQDAALVGIVEKIFNHAQTGTSLQKIIDDCEREGGSQIVKFFKNMFSFMEASKKNDPPADMEKLIAIARSAEASDIMSRRQIDDAVSMIFGETRRGVTEASFIESEIKYASPARAILGLAREFSDLWTKPCHVPGYPKSEALAIMELNMEKNNKVIELKKDGLLKAKRLLEKIFVGPPRLIERFKKEYGSYEIAIATEMNSEENIEYEILQTNLTQADKNTMTNLGERPSSKDGTPFVPSLIPERNPYKFRLPESSRIVYVIIFDGANSYEI